MVLKKGRICTFTFEKSWCLKSEGISKYFYTVDRDGGQDRGPRESSPSVLATDGTSPTSLSSPKPNVLRLERNLN